MYTHIIIKKSDFQEGKFYCCSFKDTEKEVHHNGYRFIGDTYYFDIDSGDFVRFPALRCNILENERDLIRKLKSKYRISKNKKCKVDKKSTRVYILKQNEKDKS